MKDEQSISRISKPKLMDVAEDSLVVEDAKAKVTVDLVMEVHMVLLQQISKIKEMEPMELSKNGKHNNEELDKVPKIGCGFG
jgi:hypothetical protein